MRDKLSRPFEKPLTKQQGRLYGQLDEVFKQDYVIGMTYPELFDVLERKKFAYQLELFLRETNQEIKKKVSQIPDVVPVKVRK